MLLNSSGTVKGGVAWLAAGFIIVFLAVLWLFSGRGPWAPEAPDRMLAKTVIQKKVTHIPKSLEQEAVQKAAAAIIPLKQPAPATMTQPPAPDTTAKPPDPIVAGPPVKEEPAAPAPAPIITAEQAKKSQVAAEEPPADKMQPAVKEQPAIASPPPRNLVLNPKPSRRP